MTDAISSQVSPMSLEPTSQYDNREGSRTPKQNDLALRPQEVTIPDVRLSVLGDIRARKSNDSSFILHKTTVTWKSQPTGADSTVDVLPLPLFGEKVVYDRSDGTLKLRGHRWRSFSGDSAWKLKAQFHPDPKRYEGVEG